MVAFFVAGPLAAQDAPLKVRFQGRDSTAVGRVNPFAKVRLRLQFENPADEPRWIVTTLDRATKLDQKLKPNAEADLPFFALKTADASGKQVVLVGFIGEPRFTAVRLPEKSKVVVDGFELPADADVGEMDWALAKSIDVTYGNGEKTAVIPLETWIESWSKASVTSAAGAIAARDAVWSDLLRDENGALRGNPPPRKEDVLDVKIDSSRTGRLAVEEYEARGKFYLQAERPKSVAVGGWRLAARFKPVQPLKVDDLAFSPDGSWLATSLQSFKVLGLDLTTGSEKVFPQSATARARFFAFSADGHLLVKETNADKRTMVQDWTAGKEFAPLREASPSGLAGNDHIASPNGDRVVITSPGVFQVRDFAKPDTVKLARPENDVGFTYRSGSFAPDGKRFAAGFENPTMGGKVYVWDLIPGVGDKRDSGLPPRDVFTERQTGIHHLAFSADGSVLAGSGKQSTAVWVWRLDSGKETPIRLEGGIANVHALAMSPDGKLAAISATSFVADAPIPPLSLRQSSDGATTAVLTGLRAPIHAIAFSRDGRRFAAGDGEGLIQVWEHE